MSQKLIRLAVSPLGPGMGALWVRTVSDVIMYPRALRAETCASSSNANNMIFDASCPILVGTGLNV